MNQKELSRLVAKKTGLKIKDSTLIISTALNEIMNCIANDERVVLSNFGTFEAKARKQRHTINPYTGEKMFVPQLHTPHFKPSKKFKKHTENRHRYLKRNSRSSNTYTFID